MFVFAALYSRLRKFGRHHSTLSEEGPHHLICAILILQLTQKSILMLVLLASHMYLHNAMWECQWSRLFLLQAVDSAEQKVNSLQQRRNIWRFGGLLDNLALISRVDNSLLWQISYAMSADLFQICVWALRTLGSLSARIWFDGSRQIRAETFRREFSFSVCSSWDRTRPLLSHEDILSLALFTFQSFSTGQLKDS